MYFIQHFLLRCIVRNKPCFAGLCWQRSPSDRKGISMLRIHEQHVTGHALPYACWHVLAKDGFLMLEGTFILYEKFQCGAHSHLLCCCTIHHALPCACRNVLAKDGFPKLEGMSTLYEMFESSVRRFGDCDCLGWRPQEGDTFGAYKWLTYREVHGAAQASALKRGGWGWGCVWQCLCISQHLVEVHQCVLCLDYCLGWQP